MFDLDLKQHAITTLILKGYDKEEINSRLIYRTRKALTKAYSTIYKSVALDIDGTLTKPGSSSLHQDLVQSVADLLRQGVPVVLITGRGRGSARSAVQQIITRTGINFWHLSLLSVITHNGVLWLRSRTNKMNLLSLGKILEEEIYLAPPFVQVREFLYLLYSDREIARALAKGSITITEEPSTDPRGLRISVDSGAQNLLTYVKQLLERIAEKFKGIYITHGTYGTKTSFDVYNTNKVLAIRSYCEIMGFRLNEVLRIGDEGGEGGNDFEFLDSSRAFSVKNLSSHPERCFPVLDEAGFTQLQGSAATHALLQRVRILAPLTLYPSPSNQYNSQFERTFFSDFLNFEQIALKRSRQEHKFLSDGLMLRLKRLFGNNIDIEYIREEDIFEPLNGGVRIWNWELLVQQTNPLFGLFNIDSQILSHPYNREYTWCLPTDEVILLRGPHYYWAMTNYNTLRTRNYLGLYKDVTLAFIEKAINAVGRLSANQRDFTTFKLLLGVMDNIRNIILKWAYVIYRIEMLWKDYTDFSYTKKFFDQALLPHTRITLDTLLNADLYWEALLEKYSNILAKIYDVLRQTGDYCLGKVDAYHAKYQKPLLRKWREADNFVENILAIEIGLHEIGERFRDEDPIAMIGLTYGGIELPVLAKIIGEKKKIRIIPGWAKLSLYGNKDVRYKVLRGDITEEYFEQFNKEFYDSVILLSEYNLQSNNSKVVLLDDNCTTCRTIGFARDWLEKRGIKVIGAIVVRYPGSNRYLQMQLPNHGAPNPRMFLTFVKGLVTPSPYSRLMRNIFSDLVSTDMRSIYLDKTKIFDLSRAKIERYLQKATGEKNT